MANGYATFDLFYVVFLSEQSAKELELLNAAASGDFTAVQSIITSKKISNLNYQNEVNCKLLASLYMPTIILDLC